MGSYCIGVQTASNYIFFNFPILDIIIADKRLSELHLITE